MCGVSRTRKGAKCFIDDSCRIYLKHKRIVHILLLIAVLLIAGCRPSSKLPARGSLPNTTSWCERSTFGLAALQVGHDVQADAKLSQFTQLAASEPAGWANWGLLALRQRNYDTASERLQRARVSRLTTTTFNICSDCWKAVAAKQRKRLPHCAKSVELDPNNLIAVYKLAEEVERQGDEQSSAEDFNR